MKTKKFFSILLMIAIIITSAFLTVNAGAENIFDIAKTIESGKSYKTSLPDNTYYKFTVKKSGSLKFKFTSNNYCTDIALFDSAGKYYYPTKSTITAGDGQNWFGDFQIYHNRTFERSEGTLTYKVKKGTYCIRVKTSRSGGSGNFSFKATFPDKAAENDAEIAYITIPMKAGKTLTLKADLSVDTDDNVKWTSSAPAVAAVDENGKISAKAKGTAVITASLGESTQKIKIKVTA